MSPSQKASWLLRKLACFVSSHVSLRSWKMCCDIVSQFILVEMTALNYGFAFGHNGERNGKSVLLALFSALVRRLPREFSAREPPYEDKMPEIIWALEHQVKRKCNKTVVTRRQGICRTPSESFRGETQVARRTRQAGNYCRLIGQQLTNDRVGQWELWAVLLSLLPVKLAGAANDLQINHWLNINPIRGLVYGY